MPSFASPPCPYADTCCPLSGLLLAHLTYPPHPTALHPAPRTSVCREWRRHASSQTCLYMCRVLPKTLPKHLVHDDILSAVVPYTSTYHDGHIWNDCLHIVVQTQHWRDSIQSSWQWPTSSGEKENRAHAGGDCDDLCPLLVALFHLPCLPAVLPPDGVLSLGSDHLAVVWLQQLLYKPHCVLLPQWIVQTKLGQITMSPWCVSSTVQYGN